MSSGVAAAMKMAVERFGIDSLWPALKSCLQTKKLYEIDTALKTLSEIPNTQNHHMEELVRPLVPIFLAKVGNVSQPEHRGWLVQREGNTTSYTGYGPSRQFHDFKKLYLLCGNHRFLETMDSLIDGMLALPPHIPITKNFYLPVIHTMITDWKHNDAGGGPPPGLHRILSTIINDKAVVARAATSLMDGATTQQYYHGSRDRKAVHTDLQVILWGLDKVGAEMAALDDIFKTALRVDLSPGGE